MSSVARRQASDDRRAPSHQRCRQLGELVEEARRYDMGRVHILAWRDLDDPEAGGSELHAHRIASLWAAAGLDVTMRTSRAEGHPSSTERDGYQVVRQVGQIRGVPQERAERSLSRHGRNDGLVEIWNGMPFFSPVWATGPRIVFLHHVHAEMWQMTLPPNLAGAGPLRGADGSRHRSTGARRIVTLSESSRDEIVSMLKMRPRPRHGRAARGRGPRSHPAASAPRPLWSWPSEDSSR